MIHVSYLTRSDKDNLKKLGYNPKDFLRLRKTAEGFVYLQVKTGKELPIRG